MKKYLETSTRYQKYILKTAFYFHKLLKYNKKIGFLESNSETLSMRLQCLSVTSVTGLNLLRQRFPNFF